jgi:hypothetical protein
MRIGLLIFYVPGLLFIENDYVLIFVW